MKSCSAGLNSHTKQGQTTLARLLKVTRQADGQVYGFTDHDQDLAFGGVTYLSSTSYNPFNLNSKADGDAATTELTGAFDSVITRADVLAGRWDNATFQLLLVNWYDVIHAAGSQGSAILAAGSFGTFEVQEFGFKVQLHGLSYRLTFIGGDFCGPTCRADFGDSKCAPGGLLASGTAINSLLQSGSVSSTPDGYRTLVVSGISNLGKPLDGGLLTFTSGANNLLSAEIVHVDFGTNSVTLRPWTQLAPVAPGDNFSIMPTCDKVFTTCVLTYNNAQNNQSEPQAPTPDAVIEYPDYVAPHG
jgi:uncharacterized phage protein (TIGR02218 family)